MTKDDVVRKNTDRNSTYCRECGAEVGIRYTLHGKLVCHDCYEKHINSKEFWSESYRCLSKYC